MLDRLLLVIAFAAVGYAAWQMFTRWQLRRAASAGRARDPLLANVPQGIPTIVYFKTQACAPCQLQQTPTLDGLKREMGDRLAVVSVDAAAQPDAASRWGVMSVPTVFVLHADGTPRKVYNGLVSAAVLKQDLQSA